MTNRPDGDTEILATTPDSRPSLAKGIILDGADRCRLSDAPIVELHTELGDRVTACTHAGYGYKATNEDRIAMVQTRGEHGWQGTFFVVDGMGGHRDGHIAAQVLAEELLRSVSITGAELYHQSRELLLDKILDIVYRLPTSGLVSRVIERANSEVFIAQPHSSLEDMYRAIVDIVQVESIHIKDPQPENLKAVAEVVNALLGISLPERTEIAIRATKGRIDHLQYLDKPPDACFVGAVITTEKDGRRWLDLRQIGDCKLFVASATGEIKFRSINESVIPEPDLARRDVRLADLMTYSLHRNFVSNSMNRVPVNTKKYRRSEIPLPLEPGDVIQVYSDGCDDIFTEHELIARSLARPAAEFLRDLLVQAERRMRFVSHLLVSEQERCEPKDRIKAYPAVHRVINEGRITHGAYVESYPDGGRGSWTKPPKCDNFALCQVVIGS